VLLNEVIDAFQISSPGGLYIDATFGAGGHSGEILRRLHALPSPTNSKLFGLDRDPSALIYGKPLKQQYGTMFVPVHARFSQMAKVLSTNHGYLAFKETLSGLSELLSIAV